MGKTTFISTLTLALLTTFSAQAAEEAVTSPVPAAAVTAFDATATSKSAAQLMNRGEFYEAYKLLTPGLAHNPNVAYRFLTAQAAVEVQQVDEAVQLFEGILAENANLPRVRLELARAYALQGLRDKARSEFNAVLATNPPPVVGDNIQRFLTVLDSQKSWSLRANVAYMHDNNPQAGPSTLCSGLGCSPNNTPPREDQALVTSINFTHMMQLSGQWGWQSDVNFSATRYEESRSMDSNMVSVATGPVLKMDRWTFSLPLGSDFLMIDDRRFLQTYSLTPTAMYQVTPAFHVGGGLIYQMKDYAQQNSVQKESNVQGIQLKSRYKLNGTGMIDATLRLAYEDARDIAYTNDQRSLSIGYFTALPWWGLSLYASPTYSVTSYAQPETQIGLTTPRQDESLMSTVNLSKSVEIPYLGTTAVSLSFTETRNHSNIPNYKYSRQQSMLQISKVF